jgi:tRNA-binding EMAP/Myf-like protein
VIEVGTHPRGDHIWLAAVDLGEGQKVQIVWGGEPVVRAGDLVPVAPPGSRVHGKKMRRRNYRGQSSFGMLCSLAELGWNPDVKDRVALLSSTVGLSSGDSLDGYDYHWWEIVRGPWSAMYGHDVSEMIGCRVSDPAHDPEGSLSVPTRILQDHGMGVGCAPALG